MRPQERRINFIFVLIQTILYVSFLVIDLTGGSVLMSLVIKYIVIILCFCYALFARIDADKSILFIMRIAFFFTLISDLFLLLLDYYFYGILTFIIVQGLYQIRISLVMKERSDRKLPVKKTLLLLYAMQFVATLVICFLLQSFGVTLEKVLVVSVFYFICILTNTIRAIHLVKLNPNKKDLLLFMIGMILFLLCDLNVGLFNLSGYVSLSKEIYVVVNAMSQVLMWTFYAPSQVLLSLSTAKKL